MEEHILKKKLAGAIWPLGFWYSRQLCGSEWSPVLARLFGCTITQSMARRIWEIWMPTVRSQGVKPEALLSSSYRRRFRRRAIREFRPYVKLLHRAVKPLVVGQTAAYSGDDSDGSLKGIQLDSIPSLAEIEREHFCFSQLVVANPRDLVPPPSQAIAYDLRGEVLTSLGGWEGYSSAMTGILTEMLLASPYIQEKTTLPSAFVFLGLGPGDRKQINEANVSHLIARLCDRIRELANISPDEAKRLVAVLCGKILVRETLEHPYSRTPKESLAMPIGEDMTLEDVISSGAGEEFQRIEEQDALRAALEQLSPAERRACEFFLSGDKSSGESDRRQYRAHQRNFERALRRLEKIRTSGKQGT